MQDFYKKIIYLIYKKLGVKGMILVSTVDKTGLEELKNKLIK